MQTLQMLTFAMLFAATATAGAAAEDQTIPTITVTAKRHVPAAERVPPATPVEITVTMPTDMPEAEIDYHLAPIATLPGK
jgi:hypothetical protein